MQVAVRERPHVGGGVRQRGLLPEDISKHITFTWGGGENTAALALGMNPHHWVFGLQVDDEEPAENLLRRRENTQTAHRKSLGLGIEPATFCLTAALTTPAALWPQNRPIITLHTQLPKSSLVLNAALAHPLNSECSGPQLRPHC